MAGAAAERPGAGAGKPGRLGRAQYRPRRRQRQISRVSGYRRQTLSGHVSHAAGDGRERHLDIATCNGTYVYEKRRESHPIFPLDRLPSTDVLPGHVWLKQALDSRKFLHVTWLNIYRHDFIRQHHFHFEPGLRHQDIPWTTEALLAAERVQYTSQQFYDYYIHSESVSHKPDNDDTLMRSARHYMKILEMLEAINQRYPDKVRHIAACRWQIAKEGLGIIHTFDSMKDESKKHVIINEFFDRGIWRLIWKNACTFRLRWRLGRRYLRIKRYRHAG